MSRDSEDKARFDDSYIDKNHVILLTNFKQFLEATLKALDDVRQNIPDDEYILLKCDLEDTLEMVESDIEDANKP